VPPYVAIRQTDKDGVNIGNWMRAPKLLKDEGANEVATADVETEAKCSQGKMKRSARRGKAMQT